jgi:hypothetical protein
MDSMEAPAPVIGGLYVVAYAHVDNSIQFTQTRTLSIDGQWLGAMPNLAICQEFNTREYAIQHCTEEWEPVDIAAGYASREEAMRRIEQSYRGISSKWIDATITFEEAASDVRICNHCIEKFHASIHQEQ